MGQHGGPSSCSFPPSLPGSCRRLASPAHLLAVWTLTPSLLWFNSKLSSVFFIIVTQFKSSVLEHFWGRFTLYEALRKNTILAQHILQIRTLGSEFLPGYQYVVELGSVPGSLSVWFWSSFSFLRCSRHPFSHHSFIRSCIRQFFSKPYLPHTCQVTF